MHRTCVRYGSACMHVRHALMTMAGRALHLPRSREYRDPSHARHRSALISDRSHAALREYFTLCMKLFVGKIPHLFIRKSNPEYACGQCCSSRRDIYFYYVVSLETTTDRF